MFGHWHRLRLLIASLLALLLQLALAATAAAITGGGDWPLRRLI